MNPITWYILGWIIGAFTAYSITKQHYLSKMPKKVTTRDLYGK